MEKRLQAVLAEAGLCSRRKAEEYIRAGRVTVDGRRAELGMRADPTRQSVALDGRPLASPEAKRTILLHKPAGYVTTLFDEKGRKTVAELVKDAGVRLYPVGRLDYLSEGLLLMTNDGDLAYALTHPRHRVDKTYEVGVKGAVTEGALQKLQSPLVIDGYRIAPARVETVGAVSTEAVRKGAVTRLFITIHEGRNRQIRKMCEACGLSVTRLKRLSMGPLQLGALPPGRWRDLTEAEADALRKLTETKEMK